MHAKASKSLACASEKTIQVSWCFVSDMGAKDLAVASIPACIHETVNFIQPNGSWEGRTRELMREVGIDDVSPAVYGKYLAQHSIAVTAVTFGVARSANSLLLLAQFEPATILGSNRRKRV